MKGLAAVSASAFRHRESGQGLVEYALILILVAVAVILMLVATGTQFHNLYSNITTTLAQKAGM